MKKKLGTMSLLIAAATVMSACGGNGEKNEIILWSSFGSAYTSALTTVVEKYLAQNEKVFIDNQSQGSYDQLQTNIMNSISTSAYPNFANGYPDHFAGYIKSGIQLELDDYIEKFNEEHADVLEQYGLQSIADDYYADYMEENKNLLFHTDGTPYIVGLPFNKSTEVLGYNGIMFDYIKTKMNISKVPETWQEWANVGPQMREVVMNNIAGKYVFGKRDANGNGSDFQVYATKEEGPSEEQGYELLLDCSKITDEKFRMLSWDALDNMFITLVRQWDGQYTSYSAEDMKNPQHGWFTAWDANNKAKTKASLEAIKSLHDAKVFGVPSEMTDDSYASSAFKSNLVFGMGCSSGGLSYNIGGKLRLRLAAIPYHDAAKKVVISQGTNLALFDQGDDDDKKDAFEAMVALSTGQLQAEWAVETGYFPASKSAANTELYKEHLAKTYTNDDAQLRAYQEAAVLNENIYMNHDTGWYKFTDPGFVGSSTIRTEVKTIVGAVCGGEKTIDNIMAETVTRLQKYIKA